MRIKNFLLGLCFLGTAAVHGQEPAPEARAKSDAEADKRASEWVASLQLNDHDREARVGQSGQDVDELLLAVARVGVVGVVGAYLGDGREPEHREQHADDDLAA